MNKSEFVKAVAKKSGYSQKDVAACLDAMNEVKVEALKTEGVCKDGYFIYKTKMTNPRTGRNPKTGETIEIPAKKKIVVKPVTAVVDEVAE